MLHASFVGVFPQSGERFDKSSYLEMSKKYPGDWHIAVRNILDAGEWVVTEVEVTLDNRTDVGVSLFRLSGEKVVELREYWPEAFPVPEWRLVWQLKEA